MYRLLMFWLLAVLFLPSWPLRAETQDTFQHITPQIWKGDLDGMVERRRIRVLVVYSKTLYFIDKGVQRGVSYDALGEFGRQLNKKLKLKKRPIHMVFLPVSRDQLLSSLAEGRGDIAVANLTVTKEREKLVAFTQPVAKDVREILLTGPESPAIKTMDDLAGKSVFVRKSSSYYESLLAQNERFRQAGQPEIKLIVAPENLEDEDLMEMLQAGLCESLVVDAHKAKFWQQIFPELTLHENIALRQGATIAWAIRKDSPQLAAELNQFIATHRKGTTFGNILFQRYLKNTKYVKNATSKQELAKFRQMVDFFKRYGDQYRLDWLLMAAQGYQESGLNQQVKSPVGAIGVMQVMPATGKELNVGDIHKIEPNIHAGVKYIRQVMDRYYKDEPMTPLDKGLFTFASYNAGPARIRSLRKLTAQRGLDPNIWFNNVERIVSEKVGRETVSYVSNIYKYYVAYNLVMEQMASRRELKEKLQKTP